MTDTVPEHYYPELDSTMDQARDIAARSGPENDLFRVRTAHQRAGRGRRGHQWFDLPGAAIMMTIAIRRGGTFDPDDRNPGSLALRSGAGLLTAIHDCLSQNEQPRVQIKWPNDILLDGRKLAGILVEADPRWYYVGFGINTFRPQTREAQLFTAGARALAGERDFPAAADSEFAHTTAAELTPEPASLRELSGIPEDSTFLPRFDSAFLTALHGDRWNDIVMRHLAWRGELVTLVDGGIDRTERDQGIAGILVGVSADGAVRILRDGVEITGYAGTLRRK